MLYLYIYANKVSNVILCVALSVNVSYVCALFNALLALLLLKTGKGIFATLLLALAESCDVLSAGKEG